MINENLNAQYIFWLDFWREGRSLWPKSGQFKCIISSEKIHVVPLDNEPNRFLNIDISAITKCKIGFSGNNNRHIELFLGTHRYLISPVHPIDPNGVQNLNHKEVSALIKVIEAFRAKAHPEIDANPYIRQLAEKNNLTGFNIIDRSWDKNVSPWEYLDLYEDKNLRLKRFLKTLAVIAIVIVVGIPLLLGIAYILDVLNII